MKRLVFAPAARADLLDIAQYIRQESPQRAVTFVAELRSKAALAAAHPRAFATRDDISVGLRSIVHGRYLILYRELEVDVRIVRVVHSARDLKRLFER